MGCDIHCYTEVHKGGKWIKVGKIFDYPYHRPDEKSKIDPDGFEWNPKKTDRPYIHRNYRLFSILANVRNGFGFAGCDTGDPLVPISMPKGLPDDVSPEIKNESENWGCDGHSHSWFTLADLKSYNWDQTAVIRGFVNFIEYKTFKQKGKPERWCGDVGGPQVMKISNKEMDKFLKSNPEDLNGTYTKVEWKEKYSECCKDFLESTIPDLKKLSAPEYVRIVFWFDN